MAGYSTINAQFRPMSYQEMLAPVVAADTEHKAVEEQQEALKTLSSQWEQKLSGEKDTKLKNIYQGYIDKINEQSSILAAQGLTPGARKSLYNLKAQYAKDIVPIEEAYKRYQEEIETRKKLSQQDSSRIFETGNLSITGFYDNPSLQYKSLSGNEVYQMAAKDFENMSKRITEGKNWQSTAGGQYIQRLKQSGYTPQQISQLVAEDKNAPQELKTLYNNILQSYTSRGNWGESGNESIKQAINRGASYAIGSTQWDIQSNKQWEWDMQQKAAEEKARKEAAQQGLPYGFLGGEVDATNSSDVKTLNKDIEFIRQLQSQKDLKGWLNKDFNSRIDVGNTSTSRADKGMYDTVKIKQNKLTWDRLSKKYGTKNPTQILNKINNEIAQTTSQYRKVLLKQPNTELLSTMLQSEYISRKNPRLLTDENGKNIEDPKVIQTIFDGKGQFGIDKKNGKVFIVSPSLGKEVYLDPSLLSNIFTTSPDKKFPNRQMSVYDKILDMSNKFKVNPLDENAQDIIDILDPIIQYQRTLVQAPETKSSKVTQDVGPSSAQVYADGGTISKYKLW